MGDATPSGRARRDEADHDHDSAPRLFEAQAARTPSRVAVTDGSESLTYRELDRRANALARELSRQGVTSNDVVGLFADRTVEMVVGILGVWKSGAGYLPLDPSYPTERLRFLVTDSGAGLVVNATAERRPFPFVERYVVPLTAEGSDERPEVAVAGSDLAYVIYTSGSTGVPKGVLLEHEGLARLMTFTSEQMSLDENDRVLQFASFSFDASIWEILAALLSGATLVLADRDRLLPGPNLQHLLKEQRITIALLSPSVLRLLEPAGLDALRILVAGTEKLTSDLVRRFAPGRRFFNAYGPTETTIYSTIHEIEDVDDEAPSIGRAIPGTEIFLLDEELRPVPEGEPGELVIGGVGVGRGYLNREALSAERFVSLSLEGAEARRVYRTGDRARLRPDGNLDYLGRTDYQVKVRGFRVELPEIEAVLETHEAVGSAAVVDGRDGLGQTVLWAYFVPEPFRSVTPLTLRRFLAEKLPDYMIPSTFTELPRWPLNPNGKLDRKALPPPSGETEPSNASLSATEALLSELVREVLSGRTLVRDESFAVVGLHSLAIAQLVSRIEERLGVRLKYSEVFTAGSLAHLAEILDARASEAESHHEKRTEPEAPSTIPLSFAQERIWFLERLHPESKNAYQFRSIFTLRGALDVEALEESLQEIVSRHEILRTSFPTANGSPEARVHPFEPFELPVEEVSSRSELARRLALESAEPFDLSRLPLARWKLYRLGGDEHVLLHREHHFLHDGWSYGVFLAELAECYGAFSRGSRPNLEPPSLQYREFARRERERFESGLLAPGLQYWKRKLQGAPPPPNLPSDRPRPGSPNYRGAQIRKPLGRDLYGRLLTAAARHGVTPFVWLHAVFHVFLHRTTGASELVVGTGFANRGASELERMLGMVINTVPVRLDLSGGPSFEEILRRLKQTLLEALDHQDVPFEAIVRAANPERTSGQVLFNTFFDAYDRPYPDLRAPGLEVEREDGMGNGFVKYDLVALVVPSSAASASTGRVDAATLLWEYSTELFDESTASRMLSHYLRLLESSLAEPGCSIERLSMLDDRERARVLEWSGPPTGRPRRPSVPELFAEQVALRPDAVALVAGDDVVTYGELDRRSNRIARHLRSRGIGLDNVVGVALERGVDSLAWLLGILKAGASYLPFDPRWPRERIDFVVEDAGAKWTVTPSELHALSEALATESDDAVASHPDPDSLAYVTYTSGSTGRPKGVLVPHRAVARLVREQSFVRLGPEETHLSLAPLAFDASTFEIWGALANGARLVLHPNETPTLGDLGRFVEEHRVTTLWLTAPLFHQMVDAERDRLSGVRQIVAGGDVLSAAHVKRLLERLPAGARIVNGYGPTENTTFTCCHVLSPSSELGESVPVGRPITGTRVYLLDHELDPVGIGVPGELYAGGEGLARGYANAPDRTSERFVPDPFGAAGDRLYRTGDFCRWREDGTLEFLGRRDRQVKVRGFRVELFEVEQAISAHPEVREVAAGIADGSLVACVVARESLDAAELRRELAARVPEYLIPSRIVVVDALPLTASGKLDRDGIALPLHDDFVAPRTDTEERLAAIWREALGLERFSVLDSFFALGGHSLLATRILGRVETTFGVTLPLRALFEHATVAELAQVLDAGRGRARVGAAPGETGEL